MSGGSDPSDEREGQVYTDDQGRVWHPHSGFWAWKTAHALEAAEAELARLRHDYSAEVTSLVTKLASAEARADRLAGLLKEAEEALRAAVDDFAGIVTLNSHGASDQTYIGWLRNNAAVGERRARSLLPKLKDTTNG